MSILAIFLPIGSNGFDLCHGQVSYSSTADLRRRLAHFSCDIHKWETVMAPLGHAITNCTVLWSLVGMNNNL